MDILNWFTMFFQTAFAIAACFGSAYLLMIMCKEIKERQEIDLIDVVVGIVLIIVIIVTTSSLLF